MMILLFQDDVNVVKHCFIVRWGVNRDATGGQRLALKKGNLVTGVQPQLLGQLRAGLSSATPAFQRISRWLLDAAERRALAAADLTTGSISRDVGCSRATVVRFVRALGFNSFAGFRVALAMELASPAASRQAKALERMGAITRGLLDATLAQIEAGAFEGAVSLLAAAASRVWFGIGDSAHLAASADHRCAILNMRSQAVSASPHMSALAPSLGEDDCIIVVSQSGGWSAMVNALAAARAPVIGLTSKPRSLLAKRADVVLVTPASDLQVNGERFTLRTPQSLIIDALLVGAATRRGAFIEGWSDESH